MLQGRRGENDPSPHCLEGVQIYHRPQDQTSKSVSRMSVRRLVQEAHTVVDVRRGLTQVRAVGHCHLTSEHHQVIPQP